LQKITGIKNKLEQMRDSLPSNDLGIYYIDVAAGQKISDIKNPAKDAVFIIDDIGLKLQEGITDEI
jgi:hypothetical protein